MSSPTYEQARIAELQAELAESKAREERAKATCARAELDRERMGHTVTHYLDAWIERRNRVDALKVALREAASTLEAEGLTRSAEAAREAAQAY